jgi:hypothetical protein
MKGKEGNLQTIVKLLNNFLFISGLDINWDKSMAYQNNKLGKKDKNLYGQRNLSGSGQRMGNLLSHWGCLLG